MSEGAAPEPADDPGTVAPTLQTLLDEAVPDEGGAGARPASDLHDPVALLRRLEGSGRFHRDRRLGRVYHPGSLSLRENVASNSLHVTIDGNRVSAHVDRVSPLGLRSERPRYALGRVALHNVSGIASDVGRVLRGRQGDHRCELDCEWIPATDAVGAPPDRHRPLLEPGHSPWGVHLEARVAGTFDEDRLRQALASAAPGADRLTVVDCADDAALEQAREGLQAVAVPLDDKPPLRARLARHPGGDALMLNVNHATADGPGALMVLRSVARAYAAHPVRFPPVDFLAAREVPVRPVASDRRRLARRYQLGLEKMKDALARPVRLMPDHAGKEPGHGFHLLTVESRDAASLAALRDADIDNDVLVAALHLAVSVWNAEHGRKDGRIAALVPVDLRGDPWREGVVGNFSVTARVSTTPADRASPATALRAVAAQTARNIRSRTGTALMDALDRNGLLALWARQSVVVLQPLTANHLLDSAVLSFLGRLDAPSFGGDAGEVNELWISTPARMPFGLSVGAAVVSGRLHLTFRYPHRLFAPEAARRFAECYLAQIRLVATATATPVAD
ncbi:MAG: hypothetical protein ACR2MO_15020 [Acidimicrobiales bacterium]